MRELLAILIAACAITTSANAAQFSRFDQYTLGINGEIVPGDTARMYETIGQMRDRGEEVRMIIVNSNGGDMDEGIGIANYAHHANVGVIVALVHE